MVVENDATRSMKSSADATVELFRQYFRRRNSAAAADGYARPLRMKAASVRRSTAAIKASILEDSSAGRPPAWAAYQKTSATAARDSARRVAGRRAGDRKPQSGMSAPILSATFPKQPEIVDAGR